MPILFATCHPLPEVDVDQEPLTEGARAAGLEFDWAPWDAPLERFRSADKVVIRSTWDYIHRLDAFLAWCDALGPKLLNPPRVVRWNAHKGYLLELERAGIAIVPTELVRAGTATSLRHVLERRGFGVAVVKPAVSAGSFGTRRVDGAALTAADEAFFAEHVAVRDMLVQPYLRSVETSGERSLVTIDGEVTHAIRKTARFDGQDEAVSDAAMPVADDERAFAHRTLDAALAANGIGRLLYARVDMARVDDGSLRLMELELIEPSLFFTRAPHALDRYLRALARW